MAEAGAATSPQMAIEVEPECAQRAPQEPHRSVGEATRAAPFDLIGPVEQGSRRVSGCTAACES